MTTEEFNNLLLSVPKDEQITSPNFILDCGNYEITGIGESWNDIKLSVTYSTLPVELTPFQKDVLSTVIWTNNMFI